MPPNARRAGLEQADPQNSQEVSTRLLANKKQQFKAQKSRRPALPQAETAIAAAFARALARQELRR